MTKYDGGAVKCGVVSRRAGEMVSEQARELMEMSDL